MKEIKEIFLETDNKLVILKCLKDVHITFWCWINCYDLGEGYGSYSYKYRHEKSNSLYQ